MAEKTRTVRLTEGELLAVQAMLMGHPEILESVLENWPADVPERPGRTAILIAFGLVDTNSH